MTAGSRVTRPAVLTLALILATAVCTWGQAVPRLPSGEMAGLGLRPTPPYEALLHQRYSSPVYSDYGLPAAVDHSAGIPPARSQGSSGSCCSWATAYYYKAFQEGKERGWSFGSDAQRISPAFLYNLINGGANIGTSFSSNLSVLKRHGASSWASMPYSSSDRTSWPSVTAWREGMNYRGSDYALLFHSYMGDPADFIDDMKAHLSSGDVFVMGIPVYSDFYSIGSWPEYVYDGPGGGASFKGYHAICIVGYDNAKGDAGAFKFINSWGTSWGQSGYAWLSYDFVGEYALEAWTMTDRSGYEAQAVAELHVDHPRRNQLRVSFQTDGYSETVLNCQGGAVSDIDAAIDLTDHVAYLPPSPSQTWGLEVRDTTAGSTGQITGFQIDYGGSTYPSADPPVAIPDEGLGTASVDGGGGSENSPPSVASVAITPDPARTTDDLAATPSGWQDPDGDPEGYHWQWERKASGAPNWQVISGATTGSLSHTQFAKGDEIRVTCTPWDGTDEGTPVTDTITISNSPPTAPTVDVAPDSPATGDALSVSATGSEDPDGDTVTYRYRWFRDGEQQADYNDETAVPASATAKGQTWRCTVTPTDGTADGPSASDEVTIGNSPPTAPTVDVTPDSPATGDALSVTASGSQDPDGDAVSYRYRWFRDGEQQGDYDDETTVPASATADGETWRCEVTPTDGEADGPAASDQVTIGNSPPTAPTVDVTPDSPATGDALSVSASGSEPAMR